LHLGQCIPSNHTLISCRLPSLQIQTQLPNANADDASSCDGEGNSQDSEEGDDEVSGDAEDEGSEGSDDVSGSADSDADDDEDAASASSSSVDPPAPSTLDGSIAIVANKNRTLHPGSKIQVRTAAPLVATSPHCSSAHSRYRSPTGLTRAPFARSHAATPLDGTTL
jgi:hypothetical protein